MPMAASLRKERAACATEALLQSDSRLLIRTYQANSLSRRPDNPKAGAPAAVSTLEWGGRPRYRRLGRPPYHGAGGIGTSVLGNGGRGKGLVSQAGGNRFRKHMQALTCRKRPIGMAGAESHIRPPGQILTLHNTTLFSRIKRAKHRHRSRVWGCELLSASVGVQLSEWTTISCRSEATWR
jgi:hypothetical protein